MLRINILAQSCKGIEGCGICVHVCPQNLFEVCKQMNQFGYYPPEITDMGDCTGCLNCMICCPDFALVVETDEDKRSKEIEDQDVSEY